ncbi:MAG TPA: hypothetical protein VFT70_10995 [Nocardioides sp.]|nr:hypothetical protein [Nocardioides sp.]
MGVQEPDPSDRIALLRASLLGGRGPGASEQEVVDHTRNRPMLGAMTPPLERALVAGQADGLRAGGPSDDPRADDPVRRPRARWSHGRDLLVGAAGALLARSMVTRVFRRRRSLAGER